MNKEQWLLLQSRLKSHTSILIMVFLIGFLFAFYLLIYLLLPSMRESRALQNNINQLERQKISAEQLPIPKKVTAAEITELVKQVPIQAEIPRLILALKDLEKQTKVTIASIVFGEKQEALPDSLITGSGQGLLVMELVNLEVSGTYPQVLDFVLKLQQTERLLDIKQWSMRVGTPQAIKTDTAVWSETTAEPNIQLSLVVHTYTAPGLSGQLKDLPPVPVTKSDSRSNPTASDQEFYKLLEELKSKQTAR